MEVTKKLEDMIRRQAELSKLSKKVTELAKKESIPAYRYKKKKA